MHPKCTVLDYIDHIVPSRSIQSLQTFSRSAIEAVVRRTLGEYAGPVSSASPSETSVQGNPEELFRSPAVEALKRQIVAAGKKLWQRQYVDGNGGNISCRVSDEFVLCTPTLLSKGDLEVGDLALVDMNNRRVCGNRAHTSELLLHLEIYQTVPEAKAVIHCHPPYATAHAVAGVVPRANLVPEQEIFVGQVALAPYETPGTPEFARTVRPFAKDYNTILLSNHGIVCWGDTVMHAEWYVEVVDTYCKTILLASQLRPDLREIPSDKIAELLAIKKKLGMSLPDPRLPRTQESAPREAIPDNAIHTGPAPAEKQADGKFDKLVSLLTERIVELLEKSE